MQKMEQARTLVMWVSVLGFNFRVWDSGFGV